MKGYPDKIKLGGNRNLCKYIYASKNTIKYVCYEYINILNYCIHNPIKIFI